MWRHTFSTNRLSIDISHKISIDIWILTSFGILLTSPFFHSFFFSQLLVFSFSIQLQPRLHLRLLLHHPLLHLLFLHPRPRRHLRCWGVHCWQTPRHCLVVRLRWLSLFPFFISNPFPFLDTLRYFRWLFRFTFFFLFPFLFHFSLSSSASAEYHWWRSVTSRPKAPCLC